MMKMGHASARGGSPSGPKIMVLRHRRLRVRARSRKQASEEVLANGGKIIGACATARRFDFFFPTAGAGIGRRRRCALANAGGDTTNSVKQAANARSAANRRSCCRLIFDLQSVPALGLNTAQQGLIAVNAFTSGT
jgi:branched-chain amino acid transport system substrate-binding protein